MTRKHVLEARLSVAAAELQRCIAGRFPAAEFVVFEGADPPGLYLEASIDLEDSEEVLDVIRERLLTMQVDEKLPLYVLSAKPIDRITAGCVLPAEAMRYE